MSFERADMAREVARGAILYKRNSSDNCFIRSLPVVRNDTDLINTNTSAPCQFLNHH
jgi:hypothetical protein